jgi:hypothetical protein
MKKTWYSRRPTQLKEPLTPNTVGSVIWEISTDHDLSQPNEDLPDNIQFYEMGLNDRVNDHLDPVPDDTTQVPKRVEIYRKSPKAEGEFIEVVSQFSQAHKPATKCNQMNDTDFRERCVQYRGKNWFLTLKGKADLKTPKHLDLFHIAKELNCEMDIADLFANAFKDLNLRPKDVEEIMENLIDGGQGETDWQEFIEHQAFYYDTLAGMCEDVTIDDDEAVVYDDNICHSLNVGSYHPEQVVEEEHEEIMVGDSNPYTARPLEYGTDSLPDARIRFIIQDLEGLRILKRSFYKQEDMYTGKVYKAKFDWMSYPQRQQAWQYINLRQAQIEAETACSLSKSCREVVHWIKEFGRGSEALAMIKKFTSGGTFNFCGVEIKLTKGSPAEINHCWKTYKAT